MQAFEAAARRAEGEAWRRGKVVLSFPLSPLNATQECPHWLGTRTLILSPFPPLFARFPVSWTSKPRQLSSEICHRRHLSLPTSLEKERRKPSAELERGGGLAFDRPPFFPGDEDETEKNNSRSALQACVQAFSLLSLSLASRIERARVSSLRAQRKEGTRALVPLRDTRGRASQLTRPEGKPLFLFFNLRHLTEKNST